MKKSLHHIGRIIAPAAFLLAGLTVSSCADDNMLEPDDVVTGGDYGYITLDLECRPNNTRATEPAVDELNENRINSVIVCLWPSGGDRDDNTPPVVMQEFTGLDANERTSVRIPLDTELINRLFRQDASNSCKAFVAVNIDKGDATTVAELRHKTVESSFATQKVQLSFTMDGDGTVNFDGGKATGKILVRRSAAKITLHLNVDEKITEVINNEKIEWVSVTQGMKAWLLNGVEESTLDPAPTTDMGDVYFHTADDLDYEFKPVSDKDYPFVQDTPFYTYPNVWTDSRDEKHRTYMMLMVPWTSDGGKTFRTCYYQVPVIPLTRFETVRNTSYHVKLHVSVLGTVIPKEPKELEASYFAADWGEENIDVDIKDYRYLVVDQNDYTVNNENQITIPFYTSHPAEVVDVTMTFYRYNFSDEGSEFAVKVTEALNKNSKTKGGAYVFDANFDNKNKELVIKHNLKVWDPYNSGGKKVDLTNGDGPSNTRPKTQTTASVNAVLKNINYFKESSHDEYSRVEFVATVRHIDEHRYSETVRITQYPGIYITAVQNAVDKGNGTLSGNGFLGNTIINGNAKDFGSDYQGANYWKTSIGLSTSYLNWNPNMYLVTITQLPKGTPYTIGDPRAYNINNTLSNGSMDGKTHSSAWSTYIDAPALGESGKRKLKYYYPTLEGAGSKSTIAPKFRICSSYGGTGPGLTRELARRRAAAYQEMGYAAGRWRLPTQAEVEFVMNLSKDYKIPRLFGRSDATAWYYWCAQGAMKVPGKQAADLNPTLSNLGNGSYQRARFVYDEWYWGAGTLPASGSPNKNNTVYTFTWGDKLKSNPEQ